MMKEGSYENNGLEEEQEPWYKGPIKIILGIFLLWLLVLWLIPQYGIKQNPEPNYTPSLKELNVPQLMIPEVLESSKNNLNAYIQVTPEIKQIADRIVSLSCEQTHKVCNAKAIFYFVKKNFDYVNDPLTREHYKTPQESFQAPVLDCDDYSILLSSLLQAVGLPTRFVFVPAHVYIQVRIPEAISAYKDEEDWISLDPTCEDCEFGEISYRYANSKKRYLE